MPLMANGTQLAAYSYFALACLILSISLPLISAKTVNQLKNISFIRLRLTILH